MKIFSFFIKDSNNANYLGKDFSQLIDECFEKSRSTVSSVDISETGRKIKVKIQLNSNPIHIISMGFTIESYDNVLFSIEVGEKAIRKDAKMKRFSPEILDKFFRNLDSALYTLSKKRSVSEGLRLEENASFLNLIDAINKVLIY